MSTEFKDLSADEARVFEQIAVGVSAGHPPAMVEALLKKGLIIQREGNHGPFRVVHVDLFDVPIGVHKEWCEWCFNQISEVEE